MAAPRDPQRNEVTPYRHDTGKAAGWIRAIIQPDGTLCLSQWDCGPLCQEVYSHDDVDSELTVAPQDKDALLLALLEAQFGGDSMARSNLEKFMESKGVPYDSEIWP
jgi:hypothetical protein